MKSLAPWSWTPNLQSGDIQIAIVSQIVYELHNSENELTFLEKYESMWRLNDLFHGDNLEDTFNKSENILNRIEWKEWIYWALSFRTILLV